MTANKQLSLRAKAAVASEQNVGGTIVVSSISAWEIALLGARGKLIFSMDISVWLRTVAQIEAVRFMPVDTEIATTSVALPGQFHKDPADRMIVATARSLSAPLVTSDAKIRAYPHVMTIW